MKRVLLALLGILVVTGICMAQEFHPRTGYARRDFPNSPINEGLVAFVPGIATGSTARVTNQATGQYVDVLVLPPQGSPLLMGWVVDLSPGAAERLGIASGATVTVGPPGARPVPPPVVIAAEPEPEPEPPPPPPPPPPVVVVVEPEPPRPVLTVDLSEVIAMREAAGLEREVVLARRAEDLAAQATALRVLAEALAAQAMALNTLAETLAAQAGD